MKTRIIKTGTLNEAADVIKRGGLVAVPTETVYGLAANGLDAEAVAKIYAVKGRPERKALSLLVASIGAAAEFCEITDDARLLAESFWPGPLTMILKKRPNVPDIVTAGGDTVGIRCADHVMTLRLTELAGVPLAAPSANPSGMPAPKNAGDVLAYFDGKIDCVVDGGVCIFGTESTIIDLTATPYRVLRHGALAEAELFRALERESGVTKKC